VDLVGIEPTTSSMPWKRAPKLRHRPTDKGNLTIVSGGVGFVNCDRDLKIPLLRAIRECGRRIPESGIRP
jgi:hypothetical protein